MDLASPPSEVPFLSSFSSSSSPSSSDIEGGRVTRGGVDRRFNRRYGGNSTLPDIHLRGNGSMAGLELTVSCFGIVLVFWLIAMMAMLVGVYGSTNVWIGPNSSILVQPNSIFVQSVKVKELDDSKSGLQLFGFYESPPLDVFVNWSESRLLSVSHKSYKGWPYYLNEGSSLTVSYTVKPENRSVRLVVDKAMGGVSKWDLNEPGSVDKALSRTMIQGSGVIELNISESSDYYVALANSNMKDVMVEVSIDVRAVLYDTKDSFFKCAFTKGECMFNAMSFAGNSIVLTSPSQRQRASVEEGEEEWYVRFTYQPRVITYVVSTGFVVCFMLVATQLWKKFLIPCLGEEAIDDPSSPQRARLLACKDDDGSSCSESFAGDDADLEDFAGKDGEGGGSNSTARRLCAICFDAARDCFYLPCGHCVSCYDCGTKVVEANGTCPICRRWIKKVKRIYTV